MERFLWVCAAGAAGTGSRYLLTLWASQRFGTAFPFGTLLVNLAGCFAMSALIHAASMLAWSSSVRVVITVGFIGGLTTYSSFNHDTLRLIEEGATATALLNVMLTMVGGVVAGLLGLLVSRQLLV